MSTSCRLFLLALMATAGLSAQVQLGTCINSAGLPSPGDSIQPYVNYIDTTDAFMSGGYQVGETVNDFILYDNNAIEYQLSQILSAGKPVLLLTGSYSCPAYRYCMEQVLPDLIAMFDTNVIFLAVYQLEAHPVGPDYSPFSDTVFTTSFNYSDSILLPQQRVYGDRKNYAYQSEVAYGPVCPLLLDGPGNEFWTAYGPSPNNAYLITKEGWVYNKYGWMNSSKYQAISDINMLLATSGITESNTVSLVSPILNPGTAYTCLVSQSNSPVSVMVTNMIGQVVLSGTIAPGSFYPLGAGLPEEGVYIVLLIADNRSQVFTFVKSQ